MRAAAALLVACAAIACGACATGRTVREVAGEPQTRVRSSSPMRRVAVGMSADEVVSLLGEPSAVERRQSGQREVWYYPTGVVVLSEGEVAFSYSLPASRS